MAENTKPARLPWGQSNPDIRQVADQLIRKANGEDGDQEIEVAAFGSSI